MNKTISFTVDGDPVANHAPLYSRVDHHFYKNKKDQVWKDHVRCQAILNRPSTIPLEPVILHLTFKFTHPKYHKSGVHYFHTKKPDCDNLTKTVKDALNKSMYQDDAQVIEEHIRKEYSFKSGVDITLTYIQDDLKGTHDDAQR